MPKITIRVPRDPKKPRTIAVEGVDGPSCKDLTAGIERVLGNTVSDTPTHEFNKEPVVEVQEDIHIEE